VKRALLERLLIAGRTGAAALATDLASGAQSLVTAGASEGDLALAPEDLAQVRKALLEEGKGGGTKAVLGKATKK